MSRQRRQLRSKQKSRLQKKRQQGLKDFKEIDCQASRVICAILERKTN
jgi:hypothetical protein